MPIIMVQGLILGVEPRFVLFSITAKVQKIEYCFIYHLKGNVFLCTMKHCSGNLHLDFKARHFETILSLLLFEQILR